MSEYKPDGNSRGVPDPVPMEPVELPAGHPKYEIFRKITRSDSATVYEAYDLEHKRHVAIKQLHDGFRDDQQQTNELWAGASLLAGHPHPHLVTIHGVDQERGWIIMELMQGSLAERIPTGPLKPRFVKEVLRQVLEALQFLHQLGKLHGRISPESLLVDGRDVVKLTVSPGFSLSLDEEFRTPAPSDRHVAPEMLSPDVFGIPGPSVDLYCLGTTAIELLTGPDFDRLCKGGDWLRWHTSPSEVFPPLAEIVRVPKDLARVIDRLVKKPVAQRYTSAQEALDDLLGKPVPPPAATENCRADEERKHGCGGVAIIQPPKPAGGPSPPRKPALAENKRRTQPTRRLFVAVVTAAALLPVAYLFLRPRPVPATLPPPSRGTLRIVVQKPSFGAKCIIRAAGSIRAADPIVEKRIEALETSVELPAGVYKVTLIKPLFRQESRTVPITGKSGTEVEVSFNLVQEEFPTNVQVVDPEDKALPNAKIRVDDEQREYPANAPLPLKLGRHQLFAAAGGYRQQTKEIVVPYRGTFVVKMPREKLRIVVYTEPADAILLLNGKPYEPGSPHRLELEPGQYTVVVSDPGEKLERKTGTMVVERDGQEFNYQLDPRMHDLKIITSPDTATVEVDGLRQEGRSPFHLKRPAGRYLIRVSGNDDEYEPQARHVTLGPETEPCEFILPQTCRVDFYSEPNSVTVSEVVPGEAENLRVLGTTPFRTHLTPGYHKIRLDVGGTLITSRILVSNGCGPFFFNLERLLRSRATASRD